MGTNGPFVSPCRPVSGMSSVGQAPAVPSACGSVAFECAPRWGEKETSVTLAATRYCTDLLEAHSQGGRAGTGTVLCTKCFFATLNLFTTVCGRYYY